MITVRSSSCNLRWRAMGHRGGRNWLLGGLCRSGRGSSRSLRRPPYAVVFRSFWEADFPPCFQVWLPAHRWPREPRNNIIKQVWSRQFTICIPDARDLDSVSKHAQFIFIQMTSLDWLNWAVIATRLQANLTLEVSVTSCAPLERIWVGKMTRSVDGRLWFARELRKMVLWCVYETEIAP